MNKIKIKIIDVKFRDAPGPHVIRILEIDRINNIFTGEVFFKKDVEAERATMEPPLLVENWTFDGENKKDSDFSLLEFNFFTCC